MKKQRTSLSGEDVVTREKRWNAPAARLGGGEKDRKQRFLLWEEKAEKELEKRG